MENMNKKINRYLLCGWSIVAVILSFSYMVEVIKGERTLAYALIYNMIAVLPVIIVWFIYVKNSSLYMLRYIVVFGFFCMYFFSMITGKTMLVFVYILPLLSLVVLYHQPRMILGIGIVTIVINSVTIIKRIIEKTVNLDNSKEIEIQIAVLFLCFAGCYIATVLYDDSVKRNEKYLEVVNLQNQKIQNITLQTITTIANTIDAKDEYTRGHSQRVSAYSACIARGLGWSDDEVLKIKYISLLHDIGKIGVPDNVLNKPSRLNDAEYELMKKHTTIGGEILKDIDLFENIDFGALYHHERYDGTGYPKGLKGKEIPVVARIISIADAYDAMTSTRVYRKRLEEEDAVNEIKKYSGTQFDPELVDVFFELHSAGEIERVRAEQDNNIDNVMDASQQLLEKIVATQSSSSFISSEFDNLTAVYNKTAGEKKIAAAIHQNKGCLLMLDVDDIRQINNSKGVYFGDRCLTVIAEILVQAHEPAIVVRYGGDEFLCYYENITSDHEAKQLAMGIKDSLEFAKSKGQHLGNLSVSIGMVLTEDEGRDYEHLINCADRALYYMKQNGKNGFYLHRHNNKMVSSVDNKEDLKKVTSLLHDIANKKGAISVDYFNFGQMYEFIYNLSNRHEQGFVIVLFSIFSDDVDGITIEERDFVMDCLESSIITSLRSVDVTSRYSSTQQIVVLVDTKEEYIKNILERILSKFYKKYEKKNVSLTYDMEIFSQ